MFEGGIASILFVLGFHKLTILADKIMNSF